MLPVRYAAVAIAALTLTMPLHGQEPQRRAAQASFTAGAAFGDGGPTFALSTGLRVPITSRMAAEVEITHARKLDFTLDLCPPPRVCVLGGRIAVTGRILTLAPHIAVQLLPASSRVDVYLLAGIGAGHVRQRYFLRPPFVVSETERTNSDLVVALSFGGGAALRISPRVSLGGDVRILSLARDAPAFDAFITPAGTLSSVRVGSRVSWRF